MKDEPLKLRESLWRRKLTDAERKTLGAQPELSADMEFESRLSGLLAQIPDSPVPSNFTAHVMQAVELEESRRSRRWNFSWNWRAFLPRAAVAALAMGLAGFAVHQQEIQSHRVMLAKNVALVAGAQPLPSVEALKNFDAIQRMSQPRADDELLALAPEMK
jgi:anti-sigma-K factor RskA